MTRFRNIPSVRASLRLSPVVAAVTCLVFASGLSCSSLNSRIQQMHAERFVEQGQQLLKKDEYAAALDAFQEAVRLDPWLAQAHSNMGRIYRRLGDTDRAIDSFAHAVRADPYSFDDTFSLARLYHHVKRFADAVAAYLAAIDLDAHDYDARLSLGVCYQQMGQPALAAEAFNKAIAIEPDRAHAYVNLGVALDMQGKYYAAVAAYHAALERDNSEPIVLVNLANTYMNQNRLKIARATLDQAIDMDPSLAAAHEARGYCLFRLALYEESAEAYYTALSLDPRLPKAHVGLGAVQMLTYLRDDTREDLRISAIEHWHRSLELDPDQNLVRALIDRYAPKPQDPFTPLLGAQDQDQH